MDTRYLLRRHHMWFFRIPIPRPLWGRFGTSKSGKPVVRIVQTLGTRDYREAQQKRWPLVEEWNAKFQRAAAGTLTAGDIERLAHRAYDIARKALKPAWWANPGDRAQELRELEGAMWAMEECLQDGSYALSPRSPDADPHVQSGSPVAEDIADAATSIGLEVKPGTETWRALGRGIVEAQRAALYERLCVIKGKTIEPPKTFTGIVPDVEPIPPAPRARPVVRVAASGMAISEAGVRFLEERQRDAGSKITESARGKYEQVFRLFRDFTSDAPLAWIDRRTASDFLDTVSRLDPDWGRRHDVKGKTLEQLLKRYGNGQLSNSTLNRYAGHLAALYKWARNRGHLPEGASNPFTEQRRKSEPNKYVPFTLDELQKLFGQAPKDVPMYWAPRIALFSGMRAEEVCQLTTSDLRREGKIWYFNVTEENEGSVKTEAGIRRVPVHSKLIELGLLDYHAKLPAGQLFPSLKRGGPDKRLSKVFATRFTTYRRNVGADDKRRKLGFHSLRKNVVTLLDNAGVTREDVAAVVGHEGRGFTFDVYSAGLELPRLQKIVEKIKYPGLRLPSRRFAGLS
jgi:integrase